MSYTNIPASLAHIKSGRLRPIASTWTKRSELLPDVPTMKESGIDMDITVWFAIHAPSKTPRAIINKIAGVLVKIPHAPEMKKRLADLGAEPIGSSPEELDKYVRAETEQWAEVVKVSGAKAD